VIDASEKELKLVAVYEQAGLVFDEVGIIYILASIQLQQEKGYPRYKTISTWKADEAERNRGRSKVDITWWRWDLERYPALAKLPHFAETGTNEQNREAKVGEVGQVARSFYKGPLI
jgi:hypothetical protein